MRTIRARQEMKKKLQEEREQEASPDDSQATVPGLSCSQLALVAPVLPLPTPARAAAGMPIPTAAEMEELESRRFQEAPGLPVALQ